MYVARVGRVVLALLWLGTGTVWADAVVDLGTARLAIDPKGYTRLQGISQAPWPGSPKPFVCIEHGGEEILPESVALNGDRLTATFPGGATCAFDVRPGNGFAVFELVQFDAPPDVERLALFSLALQEGYRVVQPLNAGRSDEYVVTLSAAEPNVHAYSTSLGRSDADRAGCSHTFEPAGEAKSGSSSASFEATCDATPGGWSLCGRPFERPLDLRGCKAIRAWIRGDGNGQQFKVQLYDGQGGYRDTYFPIAFTGWQQVTITEAPLNTLREDNVVGMNLYYNGLPAGKTVECLIDRIEAICDAGGVEEARLLEDFESDTSLFWAKPTDTLHLETVARHGLQPARFGLVVAPDDGFPAAMEAFERAAGLPSPHPGGVWSKTSPWKDRSYLFITSFSQAQYDDVLAMAKRGGFDMILILQDSWTKSTGHYEVNTETFPGGLDALVDTVRRFKNEGFHVGLHFLSASVYPPDPYLTPVPDPRLFKDAEGALAADVDDKADFVPLEAAPEGFPAEDGGYLGDGAVVQIDDELIAYVSRAMEAPFGLNGCQRGFLGTTAAPHAKGAPVRHLKKSYGYFLYDMDTTILDEIATNFAKVANACDVDMLYFDGSERLQGDEWYYNARMHKTFFDKLTRKDILLQASGFSHYSWHIMARSASADGHGDLKGYLEERAPWFPTLRDNVMPLDVGWYYGYDPAATPDMFEYVLGATIGYGASVSYQVSLDAARKHPFTGDILDLIARYERLRLSGRVPEDMRARLRIDPPLAGSKPEDPNRPTELRRDYRLVEEGREAFQRVVYSPWHEIFSTGDARTWSVRVPQGPAKVGVQFRAEPGAWVATGPTYRAPEAVVLETFDDIAPFLAHQSTFPGVTQRFEINESDAREGGRCAVYTAENTLGDNNGWSVVTKVFEPALDLSTHKAIGFWLRGDGKGGQFKLQLTDGAKAADFYIPNDYSGWRYQQLLRPQTDPMDFSQVRTLSFYYNGLPAKTAVSCAIDDVKALPAVDTRTLVNPWVEVGGHRLAWQGALSDGQYLFLWPGEPWRRYGPPLTEPEVGPQGVDSFELPEGEHSVTFGCDEPVTTPVRVRVTLQPPERYEIPQQ